MKLSTDWYWRELGRLLQAETYRPHGSCIHWEILARTYYKGDVLLACRHRAGKYWDYAVFKDLLEPGSYPCDKFYRSKRACLEQFMLELSE